MKVGIYGGTFNPPHIGHIRSAKAAARQLGLDVLIVVPVGIPPHKQLPEGTPPPSIRLEMVRAAFQEVENAVVSDIEVLRPGASFTVDTVAEIKARYPDAELFLFVGTDMYLTLELWKGNETLLKSVTPAVFSRGSDDLIKIAGYSLGIQKKYGVHTETVINNIVEISSSALREMLPKRSGAGYIADTNYAYIIKHRLYGAKPDFEWLRARAHSMLNPSRVTHVKGCEEEAIRLARRWGENTDDACEAAILHDITKKLRLDEHLVLCKKYGIPFSSEEKAGEKLLHAKTGAFLAQDEFGVSDTVRDAILWHTTGRPGMTRLEKIIYLADYIEPARDFEGVDILRAMAYESLDEAMRMGLEMSIGDMKARGIDPNKTTYEALSDLHI